MSKSPQKKDETVRARIAKEATDIALPVNNPAYYYCSSSSSPLVVMDIEKDQKKAPKSRCFSSVLVLETPHT